MEFVGQNFGEEGTKQKESSRDLQRGPFKPVAKY